MFGNLGKLIADAAFGPVLDVVKDLGGKWINKEISDKQFETELYKALLVAMSGMWEQQAGVIKSEITGEDLITRVWRPLVALGCAFVLFFYVLFLPMLVDWFGAPPLRTSDELLTHTINLLAMAVGGYIAGRTAEKIVTTMKGK